MRNKTNPTEVLKFFREAKMKKMREGGPKTERDILRTEYGSLGTVDRTKKDGSSRVKEIESNSELTGDAAGTGIIRKYKYDSDGMEKSYKKRNITAKKAERKIKRIERKSKRG